MPSKTFVLHDESVNTYGFRMLTSGVDLTVFRENPVMFYNHDSSLLPIGRWEQIRIKEGQILADAVFDLNDSDAAEIARKVEDGFLRACSVGAWIEESSSEPALMLEGQTLATVTKWSLREASICGIPANHNALALYDADGKRVGDEDIPTVIELTDNTDNIRYKQDEMKKELTELLHLSCEAEEATIINAVRELSDELDGYRKREAEAHEAEAVTLTDKAIREGRLDASAREATLRLFATDHESTKAMLSALSSRVSVEEAIRTAGARSTETSLADKSWDELDRTGKLLELREQDPESYAQKFREQFGRDPQM